MGGVENLIFNIAQYIDTEKNEKVKIFGSKDSYLFNRIIDEKVNCEFIDSSNYIKDVTFDENDTIILFSYIDCFKQFYSCKAKIVIWNVLTYSIIQWNRMNVEKKLTGQNMIAHYLAKKLVISCFKKESIICMDGDTKNQLNKFINKELNFPLIPIPIYFEYKFNKYITNNRATDCSFLRITYIGRGSEYWKIVPIERVLKDLNTEGIKYELHIFTDFNYKFEEILNPIKFNNSIYYHFNVFGKSLRDKLLEISDLHFGMGTSALEGAALGIPTVLVDPSNFPIPDNYLYQWLFEKKEFSLGAFIDKEIHFSGHRITHIINSIRVEKDRYDISHKCFQYVADKHSLNVTVTLLKKLQPQTQFKDIFRFTPNSWKISTLLKPLTFVLSKLNS